MKQKLYCTPDGETAYDIDHWQNEAFDAQNDITIELQKTDIGSGNMWCTAESEFVERGCSEGCGAYDPCNGKSGRCRRMKIVLSGPGDFI